ncbi:MAG: ABC transporter permease [Candidatus Izemoplasmatales bacterium]|nr:ABC transporter permease [Candidatus Izemoplasmatales bacterium]MDD4355443.1 ABC transporter permease [Candidatus Izemoplasmatales bacterium]
MISPRAFKIRLAVRNVLVHKGGTFAVFLSLGLVMMFAIALLNIRPFFVQIFHLDAEERYLDTDLVMTFDENATARLINRRTMQNDYSDTIESALSFFNLHVFTETEADVFYVELMSALPHEMELLIDTDLKYLSPGDIVVTFSLAERYQLALGDQMTIQMLDRTYTYQIKDIVADQGLFSGHKLFVDKTALIADFFGIPIGDNLGNTVYIDVNEAMNASDVLVLLEADPEYSSYKLFLAEDKEAIANQTRLSSAVFSGLGLMIFLTMIVVLHSLFPTMTKRIERELGLVRIFGGNPRIMRDVFLIQLLIGLLLSLPIGIGGSLLIFNLTARAYQVDGWIRLGWLETIGAVLFVTGFVLIEVLVCFRKLKKQSEVAMTSDDRYEKQSSSVWVFLVLLILTILIYIVKPFGWKVDALIMIVLSVMTAFIGISVLLKIVTNGLRQRKRASLFRLFTLKHLHDNKLIHHSLRVLFIAFAAILIALSVRVYIAEEESRIQNQVNLDYIMLNIFDYQESLRLELENDYEISAKPSVIYEKVLLMNAGTDHEQADTLDFFVSMDMTDFNELFCFELTMSLEARYLEEEIPFVLLPIRYFYTRGLKIGDQVTLQLNKTHGIINLEVAGFLDTSFDEIAYTNIATLEEIASDYPVNSLVIDANGETDLLKQLANRYGSKMYYVLSFTELAESIGSVFTTAGDLFMIITAAMILSFLVVVINNLSLVFQSMKKEYAKLKTLGVKNRDFLINILKEALLTGLIVSLFVLGEVWVLVTALPRIMLFFNYYREIVPGWSTLMLGGAIMIFAFCVSYGLNYFRLKRMDLIHEIRQE